MAKVTFNNSNNIFFQSLKNSVDEYFRTNRLKKTGNWKLYIKTIIFFPVAIACYLLPLTVQMPAYVALLLCGMLGLCIACIGFNVMHDACHGSYSERKWVNALLGHTLNAMGGNAYFWKIKHNIIHHTYTNIEGIDEDIAQTRLLRQSPTQKWMPVHRYQHYYLPFIYALTVFMWVAFGDFKKYFRKKVHNTPFQKLSTKEHFIFWISKALYLVFYVVIPILSVGWLPWLIGYITMAVAAGIVLTYTFQLAHSVEEAEFECVATEDKVLETEWAIHQIRTTANFAPNNKILSWFVGGLNFQIEHHLFPRISHIHYPQISHIVKQTCKQLNLPYHSFPTVWAAVVSHTRTMKQLGKKSAGTL